MFINFRTFSKAYENHTQQQWRDHATTMPRNAQTRTARARTTMARACNANGGSVQRQWRALTISLDTPYFCDTAFFDTPYLFGTPFGPLFFGHSLLFGHSLCVFDTAYVFSTRFGPYCLDTHYVWTLLICSAILICVLTPSLLLLTPPYFLFGHSLCVGPS